MGPNAVRIAQIDSQLPSLRTQLENVKSDRYKVRNTIDSLTTAKNKLSRLLDNYYYFPRDYAALHNSIPMDQLQGSNLRDFESTLNQIRTHLKTMETRHNGHLETITRRIASEESQYGSLTGRIGSLEGQVSSLEAERRRLMWG